MSTDQKNPKCLKWKHHFLAQHRGASTSESRAPIALRWEGAWAMEHVAWCPEVRSGCGLNLDKTMGGKASELKQFNCDSVKVYHQTS